MLLNLQDYPGLLYLDAKNWNLDRRHQAPLFKEAIWSHL
jgi:hypothetical protein